MSADQQTAHTELVHEVRKCPCNDADCKKFVVWPTFAVPEASMREDDAQHMVRLLNSHNRHVAALDHIAKVCDNARQSTRRIRWIAQRARSAIAGDDEWRKVDLPRSDPQVERLETMIVSVYQIVKAELEARRDLYEGDDHEIPDARMRHEVEVLDRFVVDARARIKVIGAMEGTT